MVEYYGTPSKGAGGTTVVPYREPTEEEMQAERDREILKWKGGSDLANAMMGGYVVDKGAFQSPTGGPGVDPYWKTEGQMEAPNSDYIGGFRDYLGASRERQAASLGQLGKYASGEESASRDTMREAVERAQLRNQAAARSARSPAEARAAIYAQSAAQQDASRGGAIASSQERLAAQQAMLAGAGQMRQQDISQYEASQMERLRQMQGDAQFKDLQAKYMAMGLSDKEAERKARIAYEGMKLAAHEGEQGRSSAWRIAEETDEGIGGSLIGAAGTIGAAAISASDERCKKNIKYLSDNSDSDFSKALSSGKESDMLKFIESMDDTDDVKDFMDKMNSASFEYKDPDKNGAGEHVGVMAQDLEQSKVGFGLVIEDQNGMKYINSPANKFNPIVLASLANINKRLNKIEGE